MTELEKLDAGLAFDVNDPEVDARKLHAVKGCQALEAVDAADREGKERAIRKLLGRVGRNPNILTGFHCDNGLNIEVGDEFLANYNVTILDIAKVVMGDNVWIGPGTLIATINHPLDPAGRRRHLGIAKPIHIGNDVWIGGNATILPGVTIGSNVVVAAGAVVTRDVKDGEIYKGFGKGEPQFIEYWSELDKPEHNRSEITNQMIKDRCFEKYGIRVTDDNLQWMKKQRGLNYSCREGEAKDLQCPVSKQKALEKTFDYFGLY